MFFVNHDPHESDLFMSFMASSFRIML
jgi:hypothetical protein